MSIAVSPLQNVCSRQSADQSHVLRQGDFRRQLWYQSGLCPEFAKQLWRDPDTLLANARPLKRGNRCTVVLAPSNNGPLVVKRFNLRGSLHTLGHTVKGSRAAINWQAAKQLSSIRVASPEPRAYLETRLGPLRFRSYLVLPYLDGWRLHTFLAWQRVNRDEMRVLGTQFRSIRQQMHTARLTHGDLRADNLLVTAQADQLTLWLIDLDSFRFHSSERSLQRSTQRDTNRFLEDMAGYPGWILESFLDDGRQDADS